MKFFQLTAILLASVLTADAVTIPNVFDARSEGSSFVKRDISSPNNLFKRKGGGGGGGGRGGGGGGSSSSSGGGRSGSSGGTSGRTSGTSNLGGSTSAGSGAARSYGGGRYYGGGAVVPYQAGQRSNKNLAPVALLGVGGLAFFGGAWLYGAYLYSYPSPYRFYNATARQNQTKPVQCLCQQYSVCGCDDPDDRDAYFGSIIGDGTNLNSTLVRAARVNDTDQIFINGTLPNGTTAPGGSDSGGIVNKAVENMGWSIIGSLFAIAMYML